MFTFTNYTTDKKTTRNAGQTIETSIWVKEVENFPKCWAYVAPLEDLPSRGDMSLIVKKVTNPKFHEDGTAQYCVCLWVEEITETYFISTMETLPNNAQVIRHYVACPASASAKEHFIHMYF